MRIFINLLEDPPLKFGKLTVISYYGIMKPHGKVVHYWNCKCDCGNDKIISTNRLRKGTTPSCGCNNHKHTVTHGETKTPEYQAWKRMRSRCYNKNDKAYKNYGDRGIEVCKRWLYSYENFKEDVGERPKIDGQKYSLDRYPNNNGNYEPGNVRWATEKEQKNNKRNNKILEFNKEFHTVAEWSDILNIKQETIRARLRAGWSVSDCLTKPVEKRTKS